MRAITALIVLVALSGCLSKMERITEETKASVQASNKLISDTKDGQALGEALNLMSNREISYDLRVAAAETVVNKAPEDRVWKYAGLPAPLEYPQAERTFRGKSVKFSNVTLISEVNYATPEKTDENVDYELIVTLKDQDLYRIQAFSALNMLEQLSLKSKAPGLTQTDVDYLRTTALRVMPVAAGILGGVRVKLLKESLEKNSSRPYEQSESVRLKAAQIIQELCARLDLTEAQTAAAEVDIQEKLGVDR